MSRKGYTKYKNDKNRPGIYSGACPIAAVRGVRSCAGADFISFFTNSLEANEILAAERGVPISTQVAAHLESLVDPAVAETFRFVAQVTEDSSPIPPPDPPNWSNFNSNVYGPLFTQPVLFGELSVEDGLAILVEEGNKVLSGES